MNDRQKDLIQKFAALGSLLVLVTGVLVDQQRVLHPRQWHDVALQVTSIAYLGIGATCVIITGGIDLSVGSVLALAGVVAALAVKAGVPVPLGMLLGILSGALLRPGQRPAA